MKRKTKFKLGYALGSYGGSKRSTPGGRSPDSKSIKALGKSSMLGGVTRAGIKTGRAVGITKRLGKEVKKNAKRIAYKMTAKHKAAISKALKGRKR